MPADATARAHASVLHRLPAGWKLWGLAVAGTLAFLTPNWRVLAVGLAGSLALAGLAGMPPRDVIGSWRAAAPVLLLVFVAQGFGGAWPEAFAAVLRVATLILLATVVSATTRQSAMTEAIAAGLRPLRRLGLDPDALALGLSLALRFIPLIAAEAALVRDAQRARGLERSPLALFVPLIVRILKMADDLADAIEARS